MCMSDLSVTHHFLHIGHKLYSFCLHFIVHLKHFLFDFPSSQSSWIEGFFGAVNVFNSAKLTRREEYFSLAWLLICCYCRYEITIDTQSR